MTATASADTKQAILRCLQIKNPVEVDESPDKSNIFFGVLPHMGIQDLAKVLAKGVRRLGSSYPKTLVFCRRCVLPLQL